MRGGSRRGAGAALALVLLAGCGTVPITRYYVLEPSGTAAPGPLEGPSFDVSDFQVDPPYDQDRIVYRVGEDAVEVSFYDYHRWTMPLSRMLPRFTAEFLDESRPPAAGARSETAQAHLEGHLRALEEIDTREGSFVRVILSLTLRGDDGTVLWADTFSRRRAAAAREVREIVAAMRTLLEETLATARPSMDEAWSRVRATMDLGDGEHGRP
ncbi:MAG: ABC-type transport auxiliary lipoprotein family protein [Acidobacteriota bacterium]